MAHFAKINSSNVVEMVLVVPDSKESEGADYLASLVGGVWIQTSYNANIRKNFAGIGFSYDEARDAFIPPKEFPSWVLNETTCRWDPPVPYPATGRWKWNEPTKSWVAP